MRDTSFGCGFRSCLVRILHFWPGTYFVLQPRLFSDEDDLKRETRFGALDAVVVGGSPFEVFPLHCVVTSRS